MDGFEKVAGSISGREVSKRILRIIQRYIDENGHLPGHVGVNELGARAMMRYLTKAGKLRKEEILFKVGDVSLFVIPEYGRLYGRVNNDHQPSDFFMKS